MVAAIHDRGFSPFTISNGSLLDPVRVAASLPRIGISLDTLDPAEAEGIGRLKLSHVLANLDKLLTAMHARGVQIFTVDSANPCSLCGLFCGNGDCIFTR